MRSRGRPRGSVPGRWAAWLAAGCSLALAAVNAAPVGGMARDPDGETVERPVVVALGDSTTAPRRGLTVYPDLLARKLAEEGIAVRVVNAGRSGDTTAGALRRSDAEVLSHRPAIVVVQFGINDSMVDRNAEGPRVPSAEFAENLREIVRRVRGAGGAVVLMTPNAMAWTPALRERYGRAPYDPADPDGLNVILRRYAAIVRTTADEMDVPLVDILGAYDRQGPRTRVSLLLDGMHPNQAGHELVATKLTPVVAKRIRASVDSPGN